jgi:rhamnogalacturonan endolyase
MKKLIYPFLMILLCSCASLAQRQMENLDRGLIAVKENNGKVFVGWRVLGTDDEGIAFNIYRKSGSKDAVKINDKPITVSSKIKKLMRPEVSLSLLKRLFNNI